MRLGKDDILVIKAVLLYILTHSKDGKRDIYSLVKAAYYAQQNHLARYGTPLFKDCICALPFGPVPSNIYNILKWHVAIPVCSTTIRLTTCIWLRMP